MADYDVLGNIAIIKSEIKGRKKSKKQKIAQADKLLKVPSVKTILEKSDKIKGRLRKIPIKYVKGERNLVADYKENNCKFKFDVSTCYFSSRLSNDRKRVALKIKKKNKILVMFAGIGVYPIVIYKYSKPAEIVGVEISKECCKYFKENLKLNKIPKERIKIVQGDVKRKVDKKLGKFDVIIMTRPNLKDSFLKYGFKVCSKGTRIFYHLFCKDSDLKKELKKLKAEAADLGRKIKINKINFAGEIAPYKHRYMIEMGVLK